MSDRNRGPVSPTPQPVHYESSRHRGRTDVVEWFPPDISLEELQLLRELGERRWVVVWTGDQDTATYHVLEIRRRLSPAQRMDIVTPLLLEAEARSIRAALMSAVDRGADQQRRATRRALGL